MHLDKTAGLSKLTTVLCLHLKKKKKKHYEDSYIYTNFSKKQRKNDVGESTGMCGGKEYGLFWLYYIEYIIAIHR